VNKSEQINELATALAKAQGAMGHALKQNSNPHFGSRYADLASCLDAVREPLAAHGLAVTQLVSSSPEAITIDTVLMHASGQWIASSLAVPLAKRDAQGVGSATTYGRRYALAAICGIAQDDDDGNEATARAPKPAQVAKLTPIDEARTAIGKECTRLKIGDGQNKEKRSAAIGAFVSRMNGGAQPTDLEGWTALLEKIRALSAADVDEMTR
jgi:hypothetical protein